MGDLNTSLAWLGALAYTFQIYFDFSGYSDIAIGTAKLLGIKLMKNFDYPYISRNIAEFWRRWHISLTTWFRDYILYSFRRKPGREVEKCAEYFYYISRKRLLAWS